LSVRTDSLPFDNDDDFRELMQRVQAGSEDAAWELVRKYGGHMRRAVRRVLDEKLRPKFDSLDFVQLAWQSFFRMRDQADRFENPRHLVVFLVGVVSNKTRREVQRRLTTEKRGLAREVPLHDFTTDREGEIDACGPEPEPVDVAIARERWEQMMQDQPAHCRQIIELKLQGHTLKEIAALLHLDKMTVQRFLKRLLHATVA
jgi:RNA polymerase sigma factor (sigma-70 family)